MYLSRMPEKRYNGTVKTGKILISVLMVIFLFAGATGVAYSGTMMGHDMDAMAGCPLMGHSAVVCNMSLLDHLTQWQNQFAFISVQNTLLVLLLLLTLALCVTLTSTAWPRLVRSAQIWRVADDTPTTAYTLLRALALLEHSPTLA